MLLQILLGAVIVVFIYRELTRRFGPDTGDIKGLRLLREDIKDVSSKIDAKLKEMNDRMYASLKDQSSSSQKLIMDMQSINTDLNKGVTEQLGDVIKHVTEATESSKQVLSVANQLKELQNILQTPKQRGVFGEYYLEAVLQNVLPPGSYSMQHRFANDDRVDAVVHVKDKIIPIDSKFPLENYNRYINATDKKRQSDYEKSFIRDLKKRIEETAKYIRPAENTTDFAFMFIPSEGIYYDLLSNKVNQAGENFIQDAAGRLKVIIVSPTSFLAYLQTVLQGLKALEIEEKTQDIIENIRKLSIHLSGFDQMYKNIGKTLGTVVNRYNDGYKKFRSVDKDVTRITSKSIGVEVVELDRPHADGE